MDGSGSGARHRTWFIGIGLALAIAWTLRATPMVTLPIAIALLLALAVAPVAHWTADRLPPRIGWLGNVVALLVIVALLSLFFAGVWLAAHQVATGIERYIPRIQQQFSESGLASMLGGGDQLGAALQKIGAYAATALSMAWHTLAGLILILFLVLLMLIEAPKWRSKVAAISTHESEWHEAAQTIGRQFRVYFVTRLALGTITGLLYMGWLSLFGIDFILLWGLLALLLNFIPTIGSLIAGIFPVLLAFAQKEPGTALIVAGGLLAIEQVMGNFVDPKLLGRRLSVSPLVILVSLLLWSWIWGIAGALIAAPMTVLLIVTFAHVPALRPVALLLSRETDFEGLDHRTRPAAD